VDDLFQLYDFDIARRKLVLGFLRKAYEQAGDEDGVEEINERLSAR
jgi:hypothetical protein